MAFCSNCGQKLDKGARFCPCCGVAVNNTSFRSPPRRNQEYAGKVIKCPNCGEVLTSFTAICPACGHEINSTKVAPSIKDFVAQLDECDSRIATSSQPSKKGWSSWGRGKKFGWVLLNIYFACIPLVIYLLMPLLRYNSTPTLTTEEKRKADLIENYVFPNDRESVLEGLLFVKSKIEFVASEKIDRQSAFWGRLWANKAKQLYKKAEILIPGDRIASDAYAEVQSSSKRIKNTLKMRLILGIVTLVGFLILVCIRSGVFDDIAKSTTPLEIPETELSVLMPQIEEGKGEIVTNNSEYFTVEYYDISDSEFESYKQQCKESGFTIDCESTGSLFDAFNESGYNIRITYYNSKMHVTVTDDMEMWTISWPDTEVSALLPVPKSNQGQITSSSDTCLIIYLGNTTFDEYNEYVNACIEAGFNVDMSRTDDHFHADNKDSYHVLVEYRGFNIIFIRIDD